MKQFNEDIRKDLVIVIGSCGGLVGVYLAKYFRKKFGSIVYLIGLDSSNIVYTKHLVNEFYLAPPHNDEVGLLNMLVGIAKSFSNKIVVYFPTLSSEFAFAAKNYMKLLDAGIFLRVHPYNSVKIFMDKLLSYQASQRLNIPVPKWYVSPRVASYPVIAKPRISSGSKGIVLLNSFEEFVLHFRNHKDEYLYSEYISGREYTIDAYFYEGELIGCVPRRRIKTLGGAAVIAETDPTINVSHFLESLGKEFALDGPANFQFILTVQGDIFFTDFNLRWASGGMPLAVAVGLDLPLFYLKACFGEKPEKQELPSTPVRMYRHFSEDFFHITKNGKEVAI